MKGIKNMEINKQLFEDVLLGKLTGKFVLRDGSTFFSSQLKRNVYYDKDTCPYLLPDGFGGRVSYNSYNEHGMLGGTNDGPGFHAIVNFIPDTDMKENELTIEIPKGKQIDWQESAKQEKIVFKNMANKPRSWEEYYKNNEGKRIWYINETSNIDTTYLEGGQAENKNTLPSRKLAEAFLAMMQLMSLRQDFIGSWKPDCKTATMKWCVLSQTDKIVVDYFYSDSRPLSFPTEEMAIDFMNCFKGLLETAKPLV